MVVDFLYLQSALPVDTDFSPQNWELGLRLIEILAGKVFLDKTLNKNIWKYPDRLKWDPTLNDKEGTYMTVNTCKQYRGVLDATGQLVPTPHRAFVDTIVYAEVYEDKRTSLE